jgi:hypothetical protein
MDTTSAPQIIEHIHQPLDFTPFDCRWIPNSAKLVAIGQVTKNGISFFFSFQKQLALCEYMNLTKVN